MSGSPDKPDQISKWMPGIEAARTYKRQWLAKDIIAGLVLSTLLVPQGMAYAVETKWTAIRN